MVKLREELSLKLATPSAANEYLTLEPLGVRQAHFGNSSSQMCLFVPSNQIFNRRNSLSARC